MLDLNKNYFVIVSGREDLKHATDKEKIILTQNNIWKSVSDNSIWIERFNDYDYFHEFSGLMRIPELCYEDLWHLLQKSNRKHDQLGATLLIEEKYGQNLLNDLKMDLEKNNISKEKIKALKLFKKFSLPFGVFHWKNNKSLPENQKVTINKTWEELERIIYQILD
jgi:hypothetical protein